MARRDLKAWSRIADYMHKEDLSKFEMDGTTTIEELVYNYDREDVMKALDRMYLVRDIGDILRDDAASTNEILNRLERLETMMRHISAICKKE